MRFLLYNDSRVENFSISEVKDYLKEKFPKAEISLEEVFPRGGLKKESIDALAMEFAKIRVLNAYKPFQPNEPMAGEISFEERVIRGEALPLGVLYDGFRLQELYRDLIPRQRRSLDLLHIIFTDRFFGTYDEDDLRYHGRVIILGYPTLISTTGLVEAPAKPREFYVARRLGRGEDELREMFKGRFIDYEDERMTEAIKGYAMQGVFYHLAGEAFCESEGCRLFNAHWQEELLKAQLSLPEYCEKHWEMLSNLKGLSDP
jgi:hypothetical protein